MEPSKETISGVGKMLEWLKSPEGRAAMAEEAEEERIRQEILLDRLTRVGQYIAVHGIEPMLVRLCKEHGDSYIRSCYAKGCHPYPNHKFELLWAYIQANFEPVNNTRIPQDFLGDSYFFCGYWFTVYYGQGAFYRVYDSQLNTFFQI
jgi:hypothetical protein